MQGRMREKQTLTPDVLQEAIFEISSAFNGNDAWSLLPRKRKVTLPYGSAQLFGVEVDAAVSFKR